MKKCNAKSKSLFWGFFFISGAGLIVARSMGYLAGITLMNLVIAFLLLPIILKSVVRIEFFGILVPIAILGIMFAKELDIVRFVPWPILGVAVFLSIGLTLIFGRHNKIKEKFTHIGVHKHEEFDDVIDADDEDVVNFGVTFGSSIKYVNSKDLKQANFSASFGELIVYLDNAVINKDGAIINIDASFSGVQIYVPREWNVIVSVDSFLAGVEEKPTYTLRRRGGLLRAIAILTIRHGNV